MKTLLKALIFTCATATLIAAEPYYPKDSISDFEQEWYAKHLSAMQEPILTPRDKEKGYFAFRVLYLPTWGRPVAVRYEKKRKQFIRRSVMLSGKGGYDPGKIKKVEEIEVTKREIDDLLAALEKSGFWGMPQKDDVIGLDGSQLIIEAIKEGQHRVRVRWTPEHDTKKRHLTDLVKLYRDLFERAGFLIPGT